MPIPTGTRAIWDVTRRVNPSYTGNCIQVRNRAGVLQNIAFNQLGASPSESDPIDISALETFANGDGAWVTIMYDHSGNGHDMLLSNAVGVTSTDIKYRVCDNSGNALLDEFGNLIMRRDNSDPDAVGTGLFFETNDNLGGITTNTMFGVWSINNTIGAIFGNSNTSLPYIGYYESGGTGGRIDRDEGGTLFQLNWYRNGTQFAEKGGTNITHDGLYTEFNKGRGYYSITGGVFNQAPDANPLTNAQLFQGQFESWAGDFQSFIIYPSDVSASRADVEDYYSAELFTAPDDFASGTITLSGVAQANAVVDIISCPTVSEGTKTIVEQVTANGSGVYTATVARNTALNYWAEPRHYVEEFTGTLTPVSGTTFSTGVDLTGVSIGGANDPLYVLKSTANPSGEEVVVESRSGNDITLSYDPGFDETTTFSLGKAYGTNTVLARSSVS